MIGRLRLQSRLQSRLLLLLSVALTMGFVACGETGVTESYVDGRVEDGVSVDLIVPDLTEFDSSTDTKEGDATTAADVLTDADGMDAVGQTCEPGEGCFMEACESNDDCLSGVCVPHMGDSVCSDFCESECPTGWACKQVNVGASDVAYICVSNVSKLCVPCDDNSDCSGDGSSAVCVRYGDEGSFCGAICEADAECPTGYECLERESTEGGTSKQCVPSDGALCDCSDTSVALGLSTPCQSVNEAGSCEGIRTCTADGLAACTAQEPSEEQCNGIDDDCDGSVDEETCDDGNPCTEDMCAGEEGCQYSPLDGPGCDDGTACTIADYCQAGNCAGQDIDCNDDNPCTIDACDPEVGCIHTDYAGGCDDGDDCTFGDLCQEGACLPGKTMTCDDGNPCTDDACDAELGCSHVPNEASCDDGNACTDGDTCSGGTCAPLSVVDCDDGNPCTSDACDLEAGCSSKNNIAPCDDGNACTQADACSDGQCAGVGLDCDDGNPCTDDACNNLVGCTYTNNSAECDDSDPCTATDKCSLGTCVGLGAVLCDDGNPCTLDVCEPKAGCNHTEQNGPCDDGNACSVGDACQLGLCVSGVVSLDCDDGNPCTDEACDKDQGCVTTFNASPCDDGNACLTGDICSQGVCSGTASLVCDDGNVCTSESCDKDQGCISSPNQVPCDDGNVCTLSDTCSDGDCVGGKSMTCDDGNACSDDSCDTELGCQFQANNAACDDGNACTSGDSCSNYGCMGPTPLTCDDGNPCTDDMCDAAAGCLAFNNADACDDGSACTTDDACQAGDCTGVNVVCDDGNVCTTDSCDPNSGCTASFDNAANCDDGDACTQADACVDGACLGAVVACDDNNPCTDDSCNSDTGCTATNNDNNVCDDGNACTDGDGCLAGNCVGTDIVCDDGDGCTTDLCDPESGCQAEAITPCCGNGVVEGGEECDGGNNCNASCQQENPTVPNFNGEIGPDFSNENWLQCEGYYDVQGGDDIPQAWGNDCTGASFNKIRLVCGATTNSYRYIDVNKNVFKDGLTGYSESGLITAAKDQNGNGFTIDNIIYAEGDNPNIDTSWWNGGAGCGEGNLNVTINNEPCAGNGGWEASNCFGQGINGPRFLWVYVKP